MAKNRSVPSDVVLPHLVYGNVAGAIEWLSRVFGFVEHYRYGDPVQGAQMHLGDAWIMLTGARPDRASPAQAGQRTQSITVFVDDPDAHSNRSRSAGAKIVEELHETVYGERQYGVEDLEGHHWLFSRHAHDVNPNDWGAVVAPGYKPPGRSGLSPARLGRIRPAIERHIAGNRLAGALGLIARQGEIGYFETYGMADKEAGKPMREDTIFRIYSMTKAVTGVAAMMLFEEGLFALADPIAKFLPEFAEMKVAVEERDPGTGKMVLVRTVPAERQITVLDIMRHTAGFNYVGPHNEKGEFIYRNLGLQADNGNFDSAELVNRLSQAPLVREPGTAWDYGFATDVLGRMVEVVSGQALDAFFEERIFRPLGMNETGFFVPEPKWDRLAALYMPNQDGTVSRATIPAQESFKHKPLLLMGGAGLTSTALDYLRFARMLLNRGAVGEDHLLSPKTIELMSSDLLGNLPSVNPLLPVGHGFGITFAVSLGPGRTATMAPPGQYRWGGAAGTAFWIDPQEDMIGIFMMQTFLDLTKRGQFQQLAYQAIVD